jgi:Tol biopolymer transport system component
VTVLAQDEVAHRFPQFLPDGRHFLYYRTSNAPEKSGVFVGSLDAKPDQQDTKPLLITDTQAYYAPSQTGGAGWLLFIREEALMAQPFDPAKLALGGELVPIANSLGSAPAFRHGLFTVSGTGVVFYRGGGGGRFQLTWFDAQGKRRSTLGEPGLWAHPAVSPDGTRVAASLTNAQGNGDIWVLDTARGTTTRLTLDSARDDFPVWSPDGARIAFASSRGGHRDLYVKASDGSSGDQLPLKTDEDKVPESWSRDGKYLLYYSNGPKTLADLWVLPLNGPNGSPGKPFPFLQTESYEFLGQFSPDMRWIAYTSNESGTLEVYVRPFVPDAGSGAAASGGKWTISKGGGGFPHWRADGRQLFYRSTGSAEMAVDVNTDKSFQPGVPVRLFNSGLTVSTNNNTYDSMTADGKRFIYPVSVGAGGAPEPFTVMMNWQAGLKR